MNNFSKTEFRTKYKNIRNSINLEIREEKSKIITKRFVDNFSSLNNYFVYVDFSSEVQTGDIIKYLIENNKKISIPKCDVKNSTMEPTIFNRDSLMIKNAYGIYENCADDIFQEKIDVILLPALTVDRKGNRLGYGKGYYDKFINSLNYKPILVGLCYDEQIFNETLPSDKFDVRLDYVITDAEIIKIG